MIHEVTGNIFDTTCQIITIPINTVGAMGAGLAKQVKELDPPVYYFYMHKHNTQSLSVWRPELMRTEKSWYLLFPTKRDWRRPSNIDWIEGNLQWIRDNHIEGDLKGMQSIAIPPIGCGHGGLPFNVVKPLIYEYLEDSALDVHLYLP